MGRWLLPLLTLLLAAPLTPSFAADEDPNAARVETTREGKSPPATQKARRLARDYNANPADVQALRDRGMGWGEIRRALAISQRSDKPLAEIVELRDAGMGWGEIASRYNVSPDDAATKDVETLRREERLKDRRGRFGADTSGEGKEGRDIDRPVTIPPPGQNPVNSPVPEPSIDPEGAPEAPNDPNHQPVTP